MEIRHGSVLGRDPDHYAPLVDALIPDLRGFRYHFAGSEFFELSVRNPKDGARIYWYEIIARSHIAASTSILRLHRWWSVADHCIGAPNYLGFAAALRSFLEAAADSFHTLRHVPQTLARDASYIRSALSGTAAAVMVNKELEDSLLHFSHASKRYAEYGPQQKALHTSKYLETLAGPDYDNLKACYAELCEVVHPAADSVMLFLSPLTDNGSVIELTPADDAEWISQIAHTYGEGISHAWQLGFNVPFMSLKLINFLGPADLHIPAFDRVDLGSLASWKRIESLLSRA